MKKHILYLFLLLSLSVIAQKPNILFIAVDDLNCDINAYGNSTVKSPNLDQLADDGTIFMNNHCQQAVCGASRASLLTGWMPQKSGITSFYTYFRDLYPDMVTIPQFFKNNDYRVEGVGKIHDPRNVSEFNDDDYDKISWDQWHTISGSGRYINASGKPSTEMVDISTDEYNDGKHTNIAIDRINTLAASDQPFFFAVGFQKPHLPFIAPKKYWDLYDRNTLPLRTYKDNAADDHDGFYNRGGELRGYDDIPEEGTIPEAKERELIHGYYACVSFIDDQVGRLIATLKATGEYDNTIIIFWGDHGWHLGDHNMWTKHTNFEQATHSPLIIKPIDGLSHNSVTAPTAHIDIFPTLLDMAGFDVPSDKDGESLVPLLHNANANVNDFVVSRFTRDGYDGNALRNERYRYVEWNKKGDMKYQLFDYATDSLETQNLAYKSEYQTIISDYSKSLNAYLDHFSDGSFNFDFENITAGLPDLWTKDTQQNGSGTLSANTDYANNGIYALKVENLAAERIQDLLVRNEKLYTGSKEVYLSFYAKGTEGTQLRTNIQYTYPSGDKKYNSSEEFVLTDEYQKFSFVIETKEGNNAEIQEGFYLRFQMGSIIGNYYIDDVKIKQSKPTNTYDIIEETNILKIFPNPCTDVILLENATGQYTVYNLKGTITQRGEISHISQAIDISTLLSGMYLLSLNSPSGEYSTARFMVK